jgi:4-amino-4-deoxy-L-arabinose transferase-like glycosyltransferase
VPARIVRQWGGVFVFALGVRLLYWAVVTPDWVPLSDSAQYLEIAGNIADGEGYASRFPQFEVHPSAFRPPLYPALLAPLQWIFGEALWPGRLLNALLGATTAVLAGVFAARVAGRGAGVAAALAVSLYPSLVANDVVTLSEPIGLVLLLAAMLFALDRRPIPAGVAVGLLLLTRPNAYLLVVVLAVWFLARENWKRALVFVGIALVVVVPWSVRNAVQVGTPRLTTSDGLSFAGVYAPQAQRQGKFVDPVFNPAFNDTELRLAQFDEAEWSDRLTELAWEGIGDDPGYVLHVLQRNVRSLFELTPSYNDTPERLDGRSLRFRDLTLPLFYVVTLLGVAGMVKHRRSPPVWLLTACVAQFLLVSLVLVAAPRLRAPFDLMCCIGLGLLIAPRVASQAQIAEPISR